MKILLTHRYFWPDTPPYAAMLRSIGEGLARAGHDVHVFASKPSYRGTTHAPRSEVLGQLSIVRCFVFEERKSSPLVRAANVLLYCSALFWHVLRKRPDVVMASTFPPVVAAWTASLAARWIGARFVYHVQDIHPELSKYSAGALGRTPLFEVLRWFDNQTLRWSAAVVVLSQDMANTLRERRLGELPIHIINNFLLEDFECTSVQPPAEYRKSPDRRRVVFAGNLGRFQNLPLLVEGVAGSFDRHPDLDLLLLGDGEALPELRAKWGDHPQVVFAPFIPFAQARVLIAEADLGLVSLMPDIYRVSFPSKMLTYLGLGLPILAMVELSSTIARQVGREQVGAVPKSPTPKAIGECLISILDNGQLRQGVHQWQRRNNRDQLMSIWIDTVEKVNGE